MTKIGIITGSIRKGSESARVASVIEEMIAANLSFVSTEMLSLRKLNIPLWSEDKWSDSTPMSKAWQPVSESLSNCDGFVVITPEWAGMVPPHLKNFLLMCDAGELAHKPGLIVSVSAGMGGSYPVSELRITGFKNNYIWWLPDHVILRNVASLFIENDDLSKSLSKRILYCLNFLVHSASSLKSVREKCQNLEKYRNGM